MDRLYSKRDAENEKANAGIEVLKKGTHHTANLLPVNAISINIDILNYWSRDEETDHSSSAEWYRKSGIFSEM